MVALLVKYNTLLPRELLGSLCSYRHFSVASLSKIKYRPQCRVIKHPQSFVPYGRLDTKFTIQVE